MSTIALVTLGLGGILLAAAWATCRDAGREFEQMVRQFDEPAASRGIASPATPPKPVDEPALAPSAWQATERSLGFAPSRVTTARDPG